MKMLGNVFQMMKDLQNPAIKTSQIIAAQQQHKLEAVKRKAQKKEQLGTKWPGTFNKEDCIICVKNALSANKEKSLYEVLGSIQGGYASKRSERITSILLLLEEVGAVKKQVRHGIPFFKAVRSKKTSSSSFP